MARILVVDDCNDTAESAAKWLQVVGHDVQVAYDGYHAIDLARRQQPNFVLLDLGLPRLNGYQVASRLRQELDIPVIIIAITGYGQAEDRRRALEAECDYYFLKPVDLNGLMPLLSDVGTGPNIAVRAGTTPKAESVENEPAQIISRRVEVINSLGLHLRAAEKLVGLARQFRADVRITYEGHMANGRSILDLTTLAATCGSQLELKAVEHDAEPALKTLTDLIGRRFDEQA